MAGEGKLQQYKKIDCMALLKYILGSNALPKTDKIRPLIYRQRQVARYC